MEVIIIDSITHEWDGKGGCLEIAEEETKRQKTPNSYTAWAKVTPRHNEFIQSILQSQCHVITTVRRKQDYEMVKGDNNKLQVIKVGTKEVTRDGFEYELTLNFEFINDNHFVKASKDRTSIFMNKPEFVITSEAGQQLMNWANTGIEDQLTQSVIDVKNCKSVPELQATWNSYPELQQNETFKKLTTQKKIELNKQEQ